MTPSSPPETSHAPSPELLNAVPFVAYYEVAKEPSGRIWFPYISDGIEDILGVTPAEVYESDTLLHDLILESDLPVFLSAWQTSMRDLIPFQVMVRQRHRRAGVRCSLLRSRPKRDENGRTSWSGVQVDITTQLSQAQLDAAPNPSTELLGVCAWCSRILGTDGQWHRLNGLLGLFGRERVTHTICPDCTKVFFER